jgi:non-ribosomal peptide synthase protein (TIGR01720 family)
LSRPWHEAKIPPSDFPDRFANEKVIATAIDSKSVVNSFKTNYSSLDKDLSSRLLGTYGLELEPVLLAAFFLTMANRWNLDWIDISVSYAGRNVLPPLFEVNENRLVGFLAGTRAILLKKPAGENLSMDIREIIHQIKSVPRNGTSFSRIQECLKDKDQRKSFDDLRKKPQILFNYLGRVNTYFNNASYELAMEDTGYDLHAPEIKNSLLEFVARVNGEQIAFELTYITEYHKEKTIVEILEGIFRILDSFGRSENLMNVTEPGGAQSYSA